MRYLPTDKPLGADEALARLMDGNARFVSGHARYSSTSEAVLAGLAAGERPYATILGCSGSRVPPEIIFDAGFGDLFIIRAVGNVMSSEVTDSMQYAALHLETQFFMLLGHEGCGAVQAALAAKFDGARRPSCDEMLVDSLRAGLADIGPGLEPRQRLESAVEAKVRWSMRQVLVTPEARARMADGRIKAVGAVCETDTGRVRVLVHAAST